MGRKFHDPTIARMAAAASATGARMAITNFVPEIWSAQILENLRNTLVYAQTGVVNRNYEGDIARAGDTVHITAFTDPAVRTYTKNTDISFDTLTDAGQVLTIDQSDYFAFSVDDIDKRQALPGFVEAATTGAAYNLSVKVDTYLSGLMKTTAASGNKLGSITVTAGTPTEAYDLLVEMRTKLRRAKVPATGWFCVVPPELYAVLLHDTRFIKANEAGTTDGLRNGQVGRAAGFDIIESNTVPDTSTVFTVIAGHPMATTFAQQIAETESVRLEKQFGDGVKGLHLYAGKVVQPTALVTAAVTIGTPDTLADAPKTARGRKAASSES